MLRSTPHHPELGQQLLDVFGHVFIINLKDRSDRRREMSKQLALLGLGLDHPAITLFEAIRPEQAGEWPSIGARGCFLSHLGVIRSAIERGHDRILILEDDVNWSDAFLEAGGAQLDRLAVADWGYVHGGVETDHSRPPDLRSITPDTVLPLGQFVGLRGTALARALAYLTAMTRRQAGDPAGGPMHVDGAYCWLRKDNPDIAAFVFSPAICFQRASRTDIHDLRWFDRLPFTASLVSLVRRLRNAARLS